jgi:mono/diheme cytochrome c family protein
MPVGLYRGMADTDVRAVVAYLRSVRPVRHKVGKSEYRIPLSPDYGPPVGRVATPSRQDPVVWGRYLAGPLGHCVECHSSPGANGAPGFANGLGKGGMTFQGPWGTSLSTDITPKGLSSYSDEALRKVITTGVRPDGSRLKPPMGVGYYARMKRADLDAVVAYLRSLPAQK